MASLCCRHKQLSDLYSKAFKGFQDLLASNKDIFWVSHAILPHQDLVERNLYTSTVTPLFVHVIVVCCSAPGFGFILSGASRVHFPVIHEGKMAAVTIRIATVAQKTAGAESPLLFGVIITGGSAPAVSSFGSCTAMLRDSLINEWKHTASAMRCSSMCRHATCALREEKNVIL